MKIVDFSKSNSILNQYVSEIRNVEVQKDRLRFRQNIKRIGEIMAYEMSKDFRNIKYTLKNNYDFNIMITPELTDEVDNSYSSMQLLYYDFNSAYKILKPGEEVNLQINTTYIEREKVSKKEFKAHRLIYKCNEERDVVGYIQIGGND